MPFKQHCCCDLQIDAVCGMQDGRVMPVWCAIVWPFMLPSMGNCDLQAFTERLLAQATGLTALTVQALELTQPYRQQVAVAAAPYTQPVLDATEPYLQHARDALSPLIQQASDVLHETSVSLAWGIRNLTSTFTS